MADPLRDTLARLVQERTSTDGRIASLAKDFDDIVASAELVSNDDEHDPEGHTVAFERQQIAALLQAARAHLSELELAIARVESGTYGTCVRCGQPIGDERLTALPAARTCIACSV